MSAFSSSERIYWGEEEDQWETKKSIRNQWGKCHFISKSQFLSQKVMTFDPDPPHFELIESTDRTQRPQTSNRPLSRNKRLKLPLVLLRVKGQPVHDLILLLWRNEVLYDQIPARTQHTSTHRFSLRWSYHNQGVYTWLSLCDEFFPHFFLHFLFTFLVLFFASSPEFR